MTILSVVTHGIHIAVVHRHRIWVGLLVVSFLWKFTWYLLIPPSAQEKGIQVCSNSRESVSLNTFEIFGRRSNVSVVKNFKVSRSIKTFKVSSLFSKNYLLTEWRIKPRHSCIWDKDLPLAIAQPSVNTFENGNFKGIIHHRDALESFRFACALRILTAQTWQGQESFCPAVKWWERAWEGGISD